MTNIALIVLDTLRKDRFNEYFDWLPGTYYDNAWSTSHWTVPAHGSLFTGLYPSECGVHARSTDLDYPDHVLAERLQTAGYRTHAFSANVNISGKFGFQRGFDNFDGNWRVKSMESDIFNWGKFIAKNRNAGPSRYIRALWKCYADNSSMIPSLKHGAKIKLNDLGYGHETKDDGVREFLDFVRKREFEDREFLFMNLMEAHAPYAPPREYRTVDCPTHDGLRSVLNPDEYNVNDEAIRESYDNAVKYLSDMYKEIFFSLKGDFDVILTVGDHGELLGEYNAYEHMYGLFPELTHIPLHMYVGEDVSENTDICVNLLDVYATVLDFANIENERRGRSLRSEVEPIDHLTEFHGISDVKFESLKEQGFNDIDYLLSQLNGIVSNGDYAHEHFDDEWITHNSSEQDLRSLLNDIREDLDVREDVKRVEVDEQTIDHLEDLGYA